MADKKPMIFSADGSVANRIPQISKITPAGSSVMVEMLEADELLNTELYVGEGVDTGPPQAYIVAVGPGLQVKLDNCEDIGFKVGSRVMLQGSYVPVPNWDNNPRDRGLVEVHNIKAIIVEEDE